jgi:hypothetical protein
MFHALPPSVKDEASSLLKELARGPSPAATVDGLINLGRGVAYRIRSDELADIRQIIADRFTGSMTAQDAANWRPHITVQNKVTPREASALMARLEEAFQPRAVGIHGLALHAYDGGPWLLVGRWPFRG